MVDYLDTKNITLVNRSSEKAFELAQQLSLKVADINNLHNEIEAADIIIVATNASKPVVLSSHIETHQPKLIIDLSIPYNVEEAIRNLPYVKLINVDELSTLKDKTLKKREAEIPKAKAIIAEAMKEFNEWYDMRSHVPMLKSLKVQLKELKAYLIKH